MVEPRVLASVAAEDMIDEALRAISKVRFRRSGDEPEGTFRFSYRNVVQSFVYTFR